MDMPESARDLYRDLQDVLYRQLLTGFLRALDPVLEGPAGKVTTDHEGRLALFPVIQHGRDVR